ncbi:ATP-dependent Clp protease proteolytic subunit [Amycolatopsis rhabdoformis]|uniref:ATP-dependent Clp protease proteolytic subunit n=1 Tax=Amycolatopsis rhabdoformis TaxID=1448059 RepID=A0ABZ1I0D6_9PSEU|nr:ATP-dependent Clp protease proteolytic subunit [Amycolatopsis rhabdoformis]WSE27266.1 ATP-dependent Clp protease proteolytic subunit [Amycolatopsis rhabdoformis]
MTRRDDVARRLRGMLRPSAEAARAQQTLGDELAAESAAAAERAAAIVEDPSDGPSGIQDTDGGIVSRYISDPTDVRDTDHDKPEPARGIDISAHTEQLLQKRIIVLSTEIDDAIANTITAQMLLLEDQDATADITFFVNSPGGSVTAGMAILDTMDLVKPDIATCAMGLAAGMAQLLVSSGAPGKRSAVPHALIAMSLPQLQPDPSPLRLALLDKWTSEVVGLMAASSGQPVERVRADAEQRRSFTAAEAVDYGLVDRLSQNSGQRPRS